MQANIHGIGRRQQHKNTYCKKKISHHAKIKFSSTALQKVVLFSRQRILGFYQHKLHLKWAHFAL